MNRAIFLDRDGVINQDLGYVYKKEEFLLIAGVLDALKTFKSLGYLCVIVTNQAGIARGLYSEKNYLQLTNYMLKIFNENNIKIDGVYHCPHHPDFTGKCICRKPNPGMILSAAEKLNISLSQSYLLGDKNSDVAAGKNAGIINSYKIGKATKGLMYFDNLLEFSRWMNKKNE